MYVPFPAFLKPALTRADPKADDEPVRGMPLKVRGAEAEVVVDGVWVVWGWVEGFWPLYFPMPSSRSRSSTSSMRSSLTVDRSFCFFGLNQPPDSSELPFPDPTVPPPDPPGRVITLPNCLEHHLTARKMTATVMTSRRSFFNKFCISIDV